MNSFYLFDDNGWWGDQVEYIRSLRFAGVTDLIVIAWRNDMGAMGWDPIMTEQTQLVCPTDALKTIVKYAHMEGIRVHGSLITCLSGRSVPFEDYNGFVNIFDPEFQEWISAMAADLAEYVDGINIDYIRSSNDPPEGHENAEATTRIVELINDKVLATKPDCVISSCTKPWPDWNDNNPNGRRAIDWVNRWSHHVAFDMNYGNHDGGDFGESPDMQRVFLAQGEVGTPEAIICMGSCYMKDDEGESVSSTPDMFADVWRVMSYDIYGNKSLFVGSLFSDEQKIIAHNET